MKREKKKCAPIFAHQFCESQANFKRFKYEETEKSEEDAKLERKFDLNPCGRRIKRDIQLALILSLFVRITKRKLFHSFTLAAHWLHFNWASADELHDIRQSQRQRARIILALRNMNKYFLF